MPIRALIYFLLISTIVYTGVYIFEYERFDLERKSRVNEEVMKLDLASETMLRDLARVAANIGILADSPELHKYLQTPTADTEAQLQAVFLSFSRRIGIYDQIRFIGPNGYERVRINNNGSAWVVPAKQLQSKANHYYFKRAIALPPGQIYISPLDLNVEEGEIEQPIKPTLRVAMPLFNSNGEPQGVLVLNYLAQNLIEHFKQIMTGGIGEAMLVNGDGYWLSSPRAEDEWGFMYGNGKRFSQRFRSAWTEISSREKGIYQDETGLFVFNSLRPRSGFDMPAGSADGEVWKAISHTNPRLMSFSPLAELQARPGVYTSLTLAMLFLSVSLAWLRTNNKNKTLALQTSEWKLTEAQQLAHIGHWEWNVTSGEVEWSNEVFKIFGRSPKMFHPDSENQINTIYPEDKEMVQSAINKSLETGQAYHITHRIVCPDGSIRHVHQRGRPETAAKQSLVIRGLFQDITNTVEAAEALRIRQARQHNLVENMAEGYALQQALIDGQGRTYDFRYLEINPAFERILSVRREDIVGKTILEVFPSVEPHWLEAFAQVAMTGKPLKLQNWGTNTGRFFEVTASSPEKELVAVIFSDITERKKTEEQLRQAATVFDNTSEAIMVVNADRIIETVNEAFTEITGYKADEVVGKNPRILKSDFHEESFYHSIWHALDTTGRWHGEIWNRRKNGVLYATWENISVVKNENGEITKYVSVMSDISSVKEAQAQLEKLAHHDPLTGLANRLVFASNLEQAMERAKRHNTKLALLFLDLDGFKHINDSLGHKLGDELLCAVAESLKQTVRHEDLVARLGGDEFTIILEDVVNPTIAAKLAQKIINALTSPVTLEGHEVLPSCSIGISIYPDDAENASDLARTADAAMYHAKNAGRHTFRFYTAELTRRANERIVMERDLRDALGRNEFVLEYQPQVNVKSGEMVGIEALVRWLHPVKGFLLPDAFIPFAEESGLIEGLSGWVLDKAFSQVRRWKLLGLPRTRLAVNISGYQIKYDHIIPDLKESLQRNQITLNDVILELEITENVLHSDDRAVRTLEALKAENIHITIDDFGTGYSSLGQLKHLPVDRLKIDKGFLADIPEDRDNMAFVKAIIAMGHSLGMGVVAEGIETEAQLAVLREYDCDEAQGFYISRPLAAPQITDWIKGAIPVVAQSQPV